MVGLALVVEDEDKIRELVHGCLEREGIDVLTTASGAAALDLARSARPDVVVLDLGLPDVSGEAGAEESPHRLHANRARDPRTQPQPEPSHQRTPASWSMR